MGKKNKSIQAIAPIKTTLNDGCLVNSIGAIAYGRNGLGSFHNTATGQGMGVDPMQHLQISNPTYLSEDQLDALFRTNRIAKRLVKSLPVDSIKHWDGFDTTQKIADTGELFKICKNTFKIDKIISKACQMARLYGDGFIVLDISDGLDPQEPLDIGKSKNRKSYINSIDVLSRRNITPAIGTNYADPEYYQINYWDDYGKGNASVIVHKSRIVRIAGEELFDHTLKLNLGYNDSTLLACLLELGYYCMTQNSVANKLNRDSLAKMKIKDLNKLVLQNGSSALVDRFTAINLGLSAIGALIMDADGEDSEFMAQSYSGAESHLDFIKEGLVTASGYPLSHLLGASRTGAFSESGQSDRYAWAQLGAEYQQDTLTEPIMALLPLALQVMGIDPRYAQELTPHYRSMMVLTREELANLKKLYSEADANYAAIADDSGKVLYAQEIRNSRFGATEFTDEITLEDVAKIMPQHSSPRKKKNESNGLNGKVKATSDRA